MHSTPCVSHATASPSRLCSFCFLLDGGHGPGLNAILTGRQAHHLTDISLYESDNGIQQPYPPPPFLSTRKQRSTKGERREGERRRERHPSRDLRDRPGLISDWYYRSVNRTGRLRDYCNRIRGRESAGIFSHAIFHRGARYSAKSTDRNAFSGLGENGGNHRAYTERCDFRIAVKQRIRMKRRGGAFDQGNAK